MISSLMNNLTKINNSSYKPMNEDSLSTFSKKLDSIKILNNDDSINHGTDKIKEFLSAKCSTEFKNTNHLMDSFDKISKFIECKTPIIVGMECKMPQNDQHIPLISNMKLNDHEIYNKSKNISLSSIDNSEIYIKQFKFLHPLIFINYYKFLVVQELMPRELKKNEHVIKTLLRLTTLSCCSMSTPTDTMTMNTPQYHAMFQQNLMFSFNWNFLEQMIKYFEYSFIIHNVNENTRICYNSRHLMMTTNKYVVVLYRSPHNLTLHYKNF